MANLYSGATRMCWTQNGTFPTKKAAPGPFINAETGVFCRQNSLPIFREAVRWLAKQMSVVLIHSDLEQHPAPPILAD
jgi:hypothetical protein